MPQAIMTQTREDKHKETHWGIEGTVDNLGRQLLSVRLTGTVTSEMQTLLTEQCSFTKDRT